MTVNDVFYNEYYKVTKSIVINNNFLPSTFIGLLTGIVASLAVSFEYGFDKIVLAVAVGLILGFIFALIMVFIVRCVSGLHLGKTNTVVYIYIQKKTKKMIEENRISFK